MKIGSYDTHPAADVFPMMDEVELSELAADIKAHGLREPIWRTWIEREPGLREPLILDGRNRLSACLLANVSPSFRDYDGAEPMAFVWSLNLERRHLNASQKAMAAERARPIFEAEAKARQAEAGVATQRAAAKTKAESLFGKQKVVANIPQAASGKSRDKAGEKLGVSGRSVDHARTVITKAVPEVVKAVDAGKLAVSAAADLAKLSHERQREVMARAKPSADGEIRGGLVRAYVKQAVRAETAKQIEAEPAPMPTGPFRVIVADPPWAYTKREGDASHRGDLPYPPMTTDAICALDVASIAHEDSILWLWTTNAFMRDAYRVLDAWGFQEKTILTWVKDRIGLGDWLRGQTEHCILAVRGKPTVTLTNQTTRLDGPVREHSRKPEEFYALVDALCPGSKVEMFCRTPRPGWAKWGAETERFAEAV